MADWVKVATTDEVPPGEMKIVEVGGEEVVIANVDGDFAAFNNTCTHRGGPLGAGLLMGNVVECPFHGGRFNVRTGEAVSPAKMGTPVKTYTVQVDGKDIEIGTA